MPACCLRQPRADVTQHRVARVVALPLSSFRWSTSMRNSLKASPRANRSRSEAFKLFLIDVDHLKELNDRQGHDAGDAMRNSLKASPRANRVAQRGVERSPVAEPGEEVRMRGAAHRFLLDRHAAGARLGVVALAFEDQEPVGDDQRKDQQLEADRGEGRQVDEVALRQEPEIARNAQAEHRQRHCQPSR